MINPLVIGYKGEIGSFILQGLLRVMPKACNIWCVDIGDSKLEIHKRIKKADVIFLCVPLQDTVQWFLEWGSLLKGKTIVEQTSLKSILFNNPEFKKLNKIHKIYILSMHILFRPSSTFDSQDKKIILINQRDWEIGENVNSPMDSDIIKKITQAEYYYYDNYQHHDYDMAIKQALVHRVLLNLNFFLQNGNVNTFIGERVQELANRIKQGDKELYKIIQTNPHAKKAVEEFKKSLENFNI